MKYVVSKRTDHDSYQVTWYEDGKRRRKNFEKKIDADIWAADMQRMADIGASSAEIMAATRLAAGTGYPLDELVRAGLESLRNTNAKARTDLSFSDAAALVIENAKAAGARKRTVDGYEHVFATLGKQWGGRVASMLTKSEVDEWLKALPDRSGSPGAATAASKATYLRHIRMAMRCAGVTNPLSGLDFREGERDVAFFPVGDCAALLKSCPPKALGFVALALFAGIRPESLEILPPECVNVKQKSVRIPAMVSKDGQVHLLESEVLPHVLWKWLRKHPFVPVKWSWLQRRLKKALGYWIQDGLRHTGATYYCALHGVSATARLLTHQGEGLVRKHYAGVASMHDARRFYALKVLDSAFRTQKPARHDTPRVPDHPSATPSRRKGAGDGGCGAEAKRAG